MQEIPDWLDLPSVFDLFDHSAAVAQAAYRRFVADGVTHPSPWRDVTGQIYLASPAFLERIDRVVRGKSLVNVPSAQGRPTRLSADEMLTQVAAAYRVRLGALLDRSHREAYHTAVYLLRRAANEPLQTVAIHFRISPSRISKIQRNVEDRQRTPAQIQAFQKCKIKLNPSCSTRPFFHSPV